MLQAPDPFIQALEDHILFCPIAGKRWHCQIVFRIVPPDRRECADLHIRYRQIEPKLQLIVDRKCALGPVPSFVVGAAFAFQNAGCIILLTHEAAVKVRKRPRMIRMLIQIGVIIDHIAGFLLIPIGGNRLQKMTHHQLVLIGLYRCLHPPLFNHPQFQRCCPWRNAKNGSYITSADGIRYRSFRAVGTAFQPTLVGHTGGITQRYRC